MEDRGRRRRGHRLCRARLEILEHEIETAIKLMKDKKAEGVDGIPAGLLKGLGNKATKLKC